MSDHNDLDDDIFRGKPIQALSRSPSRRPTLGILYLMALGQFWGKVWASLFMYSDSDS